MNNDRYVFKTYINDMNRRYESEVYLNTIDKYYKNHNDLIKLTFMFDEDNQLKIWEKRTSLILNIFNKMIRSEKEYMRNCGIEAGEIVLKTSDRFKSEYYINEYYAICDIFMRIVSFMNIKRKIFYVEELNKMFGEVDNFINENCENIIKDGLKYSVLKGKIILVN